MRRGNYAIVDKSGSTEGSLATLDLGLKTLSVEYAQGAPVKIYELRDNSEKTNSHIGFYMATPETEVLVMPSFWVHQSMRYSDHPEGGTGTSGYRKAVASIYRHLNRQPRTLVRADKNTMEAILQLPNLAGDAIKELEILEVVEEDETIIPFLLGDYNKGSNFSFIALDTESNRDFRSPKYVLGSTWDMYHGLRTWEEPDGAELAMECNRFDKVVTYNGEVFDLPKILRDFSPKDVNEILEKGKSIDLYRHIKTAAARRGDFRRRGDLTLANVGFTTLGMCKWEVEHIRDMKRRGEPVGSDLMNHCARDSELTKELFFFILENGRVYYTTYNESRSGMMIESLDLPCAIPGQSLVLD